MPVCLLKWSDGFRGSLCLPSDGSVGSSRGPGPGEPPVRAAGLMATAPPSAGGGPGAAVPRVAVEGPVRAEVPPKIWEQNLVTPM